MDERPNSLFTVSDGHLVLRSFPEGHAVRDGLVVLPWKDDTVALYWMERTTFAWKLATVAPFRLSLLSGLYPTEYGPVAWILFYVPDPAGDEGSRPFASRRCHFNLDNSEHVAALRQLSRQTKWDLVLLGPGNVVADVFEFENCHDLAGRLDTFEELCRDQRITDFRRAQETFRRECSLDDLYAML